MSNARHGCSVCIPSLRSNPVPEGEPKMGTNHRSRVILSVLAAAICLCLPALFAAAPPKPASAQEQKFINEAWSINTLEVRLGQMAETKADNAEVKTFAKKMVSDHTTL